MTARHHSSNIKTNIKVNPEKLDELGFQRSVSVKMDLWEDEPDSPITIIENKIDEVAEDTDKSYVTNSCSSVVKSNEIFNIRYIE